MHPFRLVSAIGRALRPWTQRPGLSLVVLATLGVGIGASTAIFSLVHAALLRPLPYPEPDRLVTVWEDRSARGGPVDEWTGVSTFLDWQSEQRSFDALAFYQGWAPNLHVEGHDPEQLSGLSVSGDWFRVLGVDPEEGRTFDEDEQVDGAAPVVLLSHGLWQRALGGRDVVGQTLRLDDREVTIVGILPASFEPLFDGTEIWQPFRVDPARDDRGSAFLRVVGRLADGVDLGSAETDMARVADLVAAKAPADYRDVGTTLVPLQDRLVGPARPAILALAGAVLLLLLVACANVANLLLVRAVGRRQELAVRASLGAGRARLVGQLVGETLLLSLAGGGLGLVLGAWGTKLLVRMAPAGTPGIDDVALHLPVVAFALALSVVTGVVFGWLPALRGTRIDLAEVLRPGGRVEGRGQGRLRGALVVAETALALCLLIGAGLMIRSFWSLLQVDVGFAPQAVVSTNVQLPQARYDEREQRIDFVHRLTAALDARPEIASAAVTSILPMSGAGNDTSYFVEGTEPVAAGDEPAVWYRMVSPDYFATMGIEILSGRVFADDDVRASDRVVAVSERFARRWFGEENPVGRRLKFGPHDSDLPWMTIVALVRDVRDRSPMLPSRDDIYVPHAQWGSGAFNVVVRAADPERMQSAVPALRAEIRALDPALPSSTPVAVEELVADSLWLPRLAGRVLGLFAAVALGLAALGLYGVLAYSVQLRRRELGVRAALGADRGRLAGLVLGQGLRLAGLGLVLGLGLALALGGTLRGLLHDVAPTDPAVLGVTTVVLLATAVCAAWLPARRAAAADPAVSLRQE